jgi:hypothetical protein
MYLLPRYLIRNDYLLSDCPTVRQRRAGYSPFIIEMRHGPELMPSSTLTWAINISIENKVQIAELDEPSGGVWGEGRRIFSWIYPGVLPSVMVHEIRPPFRGPSHFPPRRQRPMAIIGIEYPRHGLSGWYCRYCSARGYRSCRTSPRRAFCIMVNIVCPP